MAEAIVNGVKLSWRQTGAGADVVLIHGLGANQGFWSIDFVTGLAREFAVTTFDLRGHGYSEMPPKPYRPTDFAADLNGLLDRLGIDRPHLVGHSFGGRIALELALTRPDRVKSLTIADTRLRCLQPGQVVTASPDWPPLRAKLAEHGVVLDENDAELGFSLLGALASLPGGEVAGGAAERIPFVPFGRGGTRSAKRWVRLLSETSIQADYHTGSIPPSQLETLDMPVLAVYGDDSPTRQTGELIGEWIRDCQTVFVRGGRHFHPATHPQYFLETVRSFLRRVGRGSDGEAAAPPLREGRSLA